MCNRRSDSALRKECENPGAYIGQLLYAPRTVLVLHSPSTITSSPNLYIDLYSFVMDALTVLVSGTGSSIHRKSCSTFPLNEDLQQHTCTFIISQTFLFQLLHTFLILDSSTSFKMDPNANFNGQQQPYQYQQQNQQQNPHIANSQQQGYTQQAYTGQPMFQQNTAQPINQHPMQQFGASQQLQTPLQQQPTYQSYQQAMVPAGTPAQVTSNWNQQMQSAQVTPNLPAQNATDTATSMTTTTTKKKTTKLQEVFQGRKEPSAAPSAPDFLSLMRQPPQQQQAQQQTSTDFSHLMQSAPPAQPQPQPQSTMDFSQLMQSAPPPPPPTQQRPDFLSLMRDAPPPAPPTRPEFLQLMKDAPKPATFTQGASSSSNAQTTTASTTETVGSASRQRATTQGAANLRQFDKDVSVKLKRMVGGTCPQGFDFYAVRQGYLCGGGSHFVHHDEVEAMLKYGVCPRLEDVNGGPPFRAVTPPPGNGDGSGGEPAFWTAEEQIDAGLYPFADLKDPKANPRLNGRGWERRR
jgi:hypothetical protein